MLPATITDPEATETRPTITGDWQSWGLCTEVDAELWFPEQGGPTAAAKQICAACPVKAKCLEYALSFDSIGVWGGTSEKERKHIRRQRRGDGLQVVASLEPTLCGRGLHSADVMRTSPDGRRYCPGCKRDDRRRYEERRRTGQVAA